MAKDLETRQRAEELYVMGGMTLEEVAREVDVSERTVSNWSKEGQWKAKQKEFRSAASEIRRYATLTRLNLIKEAMRSSDPQKVYAFAALEKAMTGQPSDTPENPDQEMEKRIIKTPMDAIVALQEAIALKLNRMLSQPDTLNFKGVEDMKKAMELVDEMKSKYGDKPDESRKGLSDETVEEIKRRILGVK